MSIYLLKVDYFELLTGLGIKVIINGQIVLVGKCKLMNERGNSLEDHVEDSDKLVSEGKTPMYVRNIKQNIFLSLDITFWEFLW